jgi:SSS family solute:Na+ symporter
MSTLASDLNCLSAVVVEDYYRKLKPGATDRNCLLMGKWIVVFCGLAAVGIAIAIALSGDRALSLYFRVSSILTGGVAGLFILAFLSRRANNGGIWVGIIACLIFTGWATITESKNQLVDLGRYNFLLPGIMIGVIGHFIVLIVGYVASFFFTPPDQAMRELTLWGWLDKRKKQHEAELTYAAVGERGS